MIIDAAKKEIKQLEDLLEYCAKDSDKYTDTIECISYAKEILPEMISADEIMAYLKTEDINKNMGICMKSLKERFGDSLDGKVAASVVKAYILK